MAQVVFMRGVNIGRNKRFLPAQLAKQLARYDVVNIGAAGTFVVRGRASQTLLRKEIARRIPFEAEIMVCTGSEILDLEFPDSGPAGGSGDVRRLLTVLAKRPGRVPRMPLERPEGHSWQLRIVAVSGRMALSLWRPDRRNLLDTNKVCEEVLGSSGTTRNWNTIEKIKAALRA